MSDGGPTIRAAVLEVFQENSDSLQTCFERTNENQHPHRRNPQLLPHR